MFNELRGSKRNLFISKSWNTQTHHSSLKLNFHELMMKPSSVFPFHSFTHFSINFVLYFLTVGSWAIFFQHFWPYFFPPFNKVFLCNTPGILFSHSFTELTPTNVTNQMTQLNLFSFNFADLILQQTKVRTCSSFPVCCKSDTSFRSVHSASRRKKKKWTILQISTIYQ